MSISHPDPYIVWQALTDNYPEGHFNGVIEDTFGGFFDEDQQLELEASVDKLRLEAEREVKMVTEKLSAQIVDLEH